MARTYLDIPYDGDQSEAQSKIEAYLEEKGFKRQTNKKGEEVWQQGKGITSVIKYFAVEYKTGKIRLYAWIAGVGLGSKSAIEVNLEGFYASHPKKQLKRVMTDIQDMF